MTGDTAGPGHLRRLRRRVMRGMTARAHQVGSLGMGGKTAQGIDLIRVTRAAQGLLRSAQEGRLLRTMGKMTEVTFALGYLRMGLLHDAAVVLMAVVTKLRHRGHEELRVGTGMGQMAGQTIPAGKRSVSMGEGPIRIGHILPMALSAYVLDRTPHRLGVRALQIMAGPAGPIAKGLMDYGQTRHRRRPQPHIGRRRRRCGRDERRRRRCGRRRGRLATSRAQESKPNNGQQSKPPG